MDIDLNYMSCQAVCKEGENLYVTDRFLSLLLVYNLRNLSYEVVTHEWCPYEYVRYGVSGIYKIDNRFFVFMRDSVRAAIIYDLASKSYEIIQDQLETNDKSRIWKTERFNDVVYLIPDNLETGISRFDLCKKCFLDPLVSLGEIGKAMPEIVRAHFFATEGGFIVLPYMGNTVINATDALNKVDTKAIAENVSIENATKIDDLLYITSFNDKLLRVWTPDKGVTSEYEINGIDRTVGRILNIWSIIPLGESVLCISFNDDIISLTNTITRNEIVIDVGKYCKRVNNVKRLVFDGIVHGDRVLLFPGASDSFLWVNMKNGDITPVSARLRDEDVQTALFIQKQKEDTQRIIHECGDMTLNHFVMSMQYL